MHTVCKPPSPNFEVKHTPNQSIAQLVRGRTNIRLGGSQPTSRYGSPGLSNAHLYTGKDQSLSADRSDVLRTFSSGLWSEQRLLSL